MSACATLYNGSYICLTVKLSTMGPYIWLIVQLSTMWRYIWLIVTLHFN